MGSLYELCWNTVLHEGQRDVRHGAGLALQRPAGGPLHETERGLELYSRGSWELLGHPTRTGWQWLAAAFLRASLPLPSVLGCSDEANGPRQAEQRRLEEGGPGSESAERQPLHGNEIAGVDVIRTLAGGQAS